MKWKITYTVIAIAVVSCIVSLIIGLFVAAQTEGLFWATFGLWALYCLVGLFGTAILSVFMVGICQIVDKLKEINERLGQNQSFELQSDKQEKELEKSSNAIQLIKNSLSKSKKTDLHNASCTTCQNKKDNAKCVVYDIKPFNGDCGYCDSYRISKETFDD